MKTDYTSIGLIFGILGGFSIWVYAMSVWGLLIGLIIGWIPALIGGLLIGLLWPIVAIIIMWLVSELIK
jgi:hypothetical protein